MESPKVRCICLCELVNRNSFCDQPNPTQLSYPQGAGPRQALPYHTWISASSDPNATTRIQHNPTLDAGPVSSRETPARCCSVALAASLSPRYDLSDLTINFWHSVFVRAVKKDGATSRVFWRTYVRIGANHVHVAHRVLSLTRFWINDTQSGSPESSIPACLPIAFSPHERRCLDI